jgi:hypothetical protein
VDRVAADIVADNLVAVVNIYSANLRYPSYCPNKLFGTI